MVLDKMRILYLPFQNCILLASALKSAGRKLGLTRSCLFFSLIGTLCCVQQSALMLLNAAPWIIDPLQVKAVFVCLAAAYIPLIPCIVGHICCQKGLCSIPVIRIVAGGLLGSSIGVVIAGAFAIFGENGLEQFHRDEFVGLLCGGRSMPIREQALQLLPQAELLGMVKSFLNIVMPIVLSFGCFTLLAIELYCKALLSARALPGRKLSH
jgi:hypothetical protein